MKHFGLFHLAFFFISMNIEAQTPMYAKSNGTAYNNLPAASMWPDMRQQDLFLSSDFSGATSGQITAIYFRVYGTTSGSTTFTNLEISLGQTTATSVSSGAWIPGMTTCLTSTSYTVTGLVVNGWVQFPLTNAFSYNSTLNLIVDVKHTNVTPGFTVYGTNASGRRLWSSSSTSTSPGVDGSYDDVGFDVGSPIPPPTLGPLPTITGISPSTGPIGMLDTIYGTNFSTIVANNVINYGAVRASAISTLSNRLIVSVPGGTTLDPVSVNVNGLTAFSQNKFTTNYQNSTSISSTAFSNIGSLSSGYYLNSVINADLDNDGKPDLISCTGNYVFVNRNTGVDNNLSASSFASPISLTASGGANQVITADIDGDGRLDIITANPSYNTFSVFRNLIPVNGGSITPAMFSSRYDFLTGSYPYKITAGDIDGDGKVDIVAANYSSNSISVFINTGYPGVTSFAAPQSFSTSSNPYQAILGDVDSDGKLDIIVTNSSSNTIGVYKNNSTAGTLALATPVTFSTGSYPYAIDAADMDGDGKTDVVICNNSSSTISIFRNTGLSGVINTGSFNTRVDFTSLSNPLDLKIGELNGDGKPDIVLCNGSTSSFSVWQNNFTSGVINSGSLNARLDYATTNSQRGLCIGDMDNDDRPDLGFVSGNSYGIFLHKNNMSIFTLGNISPLIYATGASLSIPFNVTLPVSIGNIFTAQLSDSAGNFTSPTNIGSLISTTSGTIIGTIPVSTSPGTQYRIRVVSNFPFYISKTSSPVRVLMTPVITSFSPSVAAPGTNITITGNYFSPILSENIVNFGPVRANIITASSTSLVVTAPQSAVVGPISVNVLSFSCVSSKLFTPTYAGTGSINASSLGTRVDFATNVNPLNIDLADIDMDGKPDVVTPNNGSGNIAVYKNTSVTGSISTSSLAARVSFATAGTPWHTQMADIDGDGLEDLISANNSVSTLSISRNLGLTGSINTSSFASRVDLASANSIQNIGYADIDGDGKTDLASANFSSNNISIFRNIITSGTITVGSFATRVDIPTGSSSGPICVVFSDVDMDGKPDMIVANNTSNNISVYKNTSTVGNINFATAVSFNTLANPRYIAVADLNNDDKPELLVSNSGTSLISVFENASASGVISASSLGSRIDISTSANPWGLSTGDIDGDGKPDIAVACNSGNVSIIKNIYSSGSLSSSSFATRVDFATGSQANGIAVCDMDGDLKPEILATSFGSNIISIFPNTTGALSLNPVSGQLCTGSSVSLTFNATAGFSAGNIFSALLSDSSGSFASPTTIGSYIGTTSGTIIATIPLSAISGTHYRIRVVANSPSMSSTDNLSDLWITNCPSITGISPLSGNIGTNVTITGTNFSATPSYNIVYFGSVRANVLSSSTTSITTAVPLGTSYKPVSVTTLNNNLTVTHTKPFDQTFVGPNSAFASGLISPATGFSTVTGPAGIAAGDIDCDGKTDLITSSNNSAFVSVFRNINSAAGSFNLGSLAARIDLATPSNFQYLKLADLDGDGKLDIVCFINGLNKISIFRNTSTGGSISFATRIDINTLSSPQLGAIADLDNDGKPDIMVPNYNSSSISVFKNSTIPGTINASGFSYRVEFTTLPSPSSIVSGDFDADGKIDLAVGNSGSGINILRNTGGSIGVSLFSMFTLTTGSAPYNIAATDIDGDGKTDVVTSNYSSNSISVYRNIYTSGTLNSSSFSATTTLTTNSYPYAIMFTDMNGDGRPDLVVANYSSSSYLSFFRNTSTSGSISFDTRYDAASGFTYLYSLDNADMDNDGKPDVVSASNGSSLAYVWRNTLPAFSVGTVQSGPYCSGSGISVPFNAPSGYFNLGNIFSAQLSDSSGSFASPTLIGSYIGSNSGTITATLPVSGLSGSSRYRIRVVATSPYAETGDNGVDIGILSCPLISSVSPLAASPGATVTIDGSNFGLSPASNIVYFGSVRAVVTSASATQLIVTAPTGATVSPLSLTVGNYSTISRQIFTPSFVGNSAITSTSLSTRIDIITGANGVRNTIASDLDGDGKPDIQATCTGSNIFNIYRNMASPGSFSALSFATGISATTNLQPWYQAVADFNNDGKLDIAVANLGSNNISIYKNTSIAGVISMASKVDFSLASTASPYSIATGDIDGDGKTDIVTANLGTNTISIFKNTTAAGIISFAPKVDFATSTQPCSVIITELDGDGKPDICVSNFGANSVSVFRNTSSTGTIAISSLASRQDYATGTAPFYLSYSDIDLDGKTDILVPNYSSNTLSVLRNTGSSGTISFAIKADFTTGSSPISIAVGDIDGDGKADVIAANQGGNNISVFKNTSAVGTISLATKVDFATQSGPICPSVCDFDGDGRSDIIVANNGSNSISIFRNVSIAPEPTNQSSALLLTSITSNSMTLSWTNGNGTNRIVLGNQGSVVNATPVDESFYSSNSQFGSGSQIGTGNYAVYTGSGNTVTVTGLNASTSYFFSVFEYNGTAGSINYLNTSSANNNAATLPVTLLNFDVVYKKPNVMLTWSTGSEINNKGFAIERSFDYSKWSEVGFVDGAGNSNKITSYNFVDDVAAFISSKLIYYRLRQVDYDGKFEILPTRVVDLFAENKTEGITIYPNPATNFVAVKINVIKSDKLKFVITDMMGTELMTDLLNVGGPQTIGIESLPKGVYTLRIENGNEISTLKLVKQ